jgi:galactose mutarotase-like enzyme
MLQGGRQTGVELIEVGNGKMTITVIPTRGMSLYKAKSGDVELGWNSPVKEIVNPAFINLEERGGLGWLDGFNEMMVRCGFEWAGHPGEEEGRLISLHGKAGNIPASVVQVIVDDESPYCVRVRGRVDEKTFKFADFQMWTELSTTANSDSFSLNDRLTNLSDYEREFQIIYHANFGRPLLEKGAAFVGAVKTVSPFDEYAAKDLKTWTTYLGPTKGYGEQVYCVVPYAKNDLTTVMLKNANSDRGVAVTYNVTELPYFTLWKNTDTDKEGYVTGLEPGTGFPYNRTVERENGRVPKLKPGETRSFDLAYTILHSDQDVASVSKSIDKLQGNRETTVEKTPPKNK